MSFLKFQFILIITCFALLSTNEAVANPKSASKKPHRIDAKHIKPLIVQLAQMPISFQASIICIPSCSPYAPAYIFYNGEWQYYYDEHAYNDCMAVCESENIFRALSNSTPYSEKLTESSEKHIENLDTPPAIIKSNGYYHPALKQCIFADQCQTITLLKN